MTVCCCASVSSGKTGSEITCADAASDAGRLPLA